MRTKAAKGAPSAERLEWGAVDGRGTPTRGVAADPDPSETYSLSTGFLVVTAISTGTVNRAAAMAPIATSRKIIAKPLQRKR